MAFHWECTLFSDKPILFQDGVHFFVCLCAYFKGLYHPTRGQRSLPEERAPRQTVLSGLASNASRVAECCLKILYFHFLYSFLYILVIVHDLPMIFPYWRYRCGFGRPLTATPGSESSIKAVSYGCGKP